MLTELMTGAGTKTAPLVNLEETPESWLAATPTSPRRYQPPKSGGGGSMGGIGGGGRRSAACALALAPTAIAAAKRRANERPMLTFLFAIYGPRSGPLAVWPRRSFPHNA